MTATKFKLPYEPPKILDLGGGVAYAAAACRAGSVAQSVACRAGGSPQKTCQAGSVAYGGFCKAGSVAGAKCMPGSVPQK